MNPAPTVVFVGEVFTCPGEVQKTKPDPLPLEISYTIDRDSIAFFIVVPISAGVAAIAIPAA